MDIDNQKLYSTNPVDEHGEVFACGVGDGAQRKERRESSQSVDAELRCPGTQK